MSDVIEAGRTIRFDPKAVSNSDTPTTTTEWYADPSGVFRSGFWSSKPARNAVHYDKDEICFILEGVVRLTDSAGHTETYKAGDSFVVPQGFKGVWETVEPTRKFYAIHRPKK